MEIISEEQILESLIERKRGVVRQSGEKTRSPRGLTLGVESRNRENNSTLGFTVVQLENKPRLRWEIPGEQFIPTFLALKMFKQFVTNPRKDGVQFEVNHWVNSMENPTEWAQRITGS
jgi:hypothetical protein